MAIRTALFWAWVYLRQAHFFFIRWLNWWRLFLFCLRFLLLPVDYAVSKRPPIPILPYSVRNRARPVASISRNLSMAWAGYWDRCSAAGLFWELRRKEAQQHLIR